MMATLQGGIRKNEEVREGVLRVLRWSMREDTYLSPQAIAEILKFDNTIQARTICQVLVKQKLADQREVFLNTQKKTTQYRLVKNVSGSRKKTIIEIMWDACVDLSRKNQTFSTTKLATIANTNRDYARFIFTRWCALGAIELVNNIKRGEGAMYTVPQQHFDTSAPIMRRKNGKRVAKWQK